MSAIVQGNPAKRGPATAHLTALAAMLAGALVTSGCTQTSAPSTSTTEQLVPNAAPLLAQPSVEEQNCLRAITAETNNADVRLINSSFSQAGTLVTANVGSQNAVWRCIAYSDGTTAGVEFTGSEGAL